MSHSSGEANPYASGRLFGLIALVASGAAIRLWKLGDLSLSYDELQSVTHAGRPFPLSMLSALLSDPHPPLYYALLSAWMRLGTSDWLILLSSTLTSLAGVASVYHVAFRLYGSRIAFFSATVCALHPLSIFWSHYARMYSLVMLLGIWVFYFNVRLASGEDSRFGTLARLALVELALVYSHVAAPFALLFIYAAVLLGGPPSGTAFWRWVRVHGVVALFALPYLYFPLRTSQSHMMRPDLADGFETLALFTNGMEQPSVLLIQVSAGVLLIAAGLLLCRRGRRGFAPDRSAQGPIRGVPSTTPACPGYRPGERRRDGAVDGPPVVLEGLDLHARTALEERTDLDHGASFFRIQR